MVPRWFLYLNGFAMLALGVAMLWTRPRQPGDSFYRRFINFGTLWALLCTTAGGALLGIALGYWDPLGPPAPPPPSRSPFSGRR